MGSTNSKGPKAEEMALLILIYWKYLRNKKETHHGISLYIYMRTTILASLYEPIDIAQ